MGVAQPLVEMKHENHNVFITSYEDSLLGEDGCPSVYFCIRLSPEALHRANVLEGLSETCGMATLPGGISNDDFLLWKNCSPRSPTLSTTQLARILQVSASVPAALGTWHLRLLASCALHLIGACEHARFVQGVTRAVLGSKRTPNAHS